MNSLKKLFGMVACTVLFSYVSCVQNPETKTPVVYPENSALFLGNPSSSETNVTDETNYLMLKSTYAISYNNVTHNPNWVSWHINAADTGSVKRSDTALKNGDTTRTGFHADTSLPAGWYQVTYDDYSGSGFTRGHMIPNQARTATTTENDEVFLMTNMVPQTANNNNTVWEGLESQESTWVSAGKELYVICGPAGKGGNYAYASGTTNYLTKYDSSVYGHLETVDYIPITNPNNASDPGIVVPASTWRVLIMIEDGDSDFTRITSDATVIAVNVPNTYECLFTSGGTKKTWKDYITTVDAIETLTGYDFFANLPDDVENALEAKTYSE